MLEIRKDIKDTLEMSLPPEIAEEVARALGSSGVYYEDLFDPQFKFSI